MLPRLVKLTAKIHAADLVQSPTRPTRHRGMAISEPAWRGTSVIKSWPIESIRKQISHKPCYIIFGHVFGHIVRLYCPPSSPVPRARAVIYQASQRMHKEFPKMRTDEHAG